MQCEKIHPLLSEKVDGALDERTSALVEAHLAECAPCRALLREFERTKVLVAGVPLESVSAEFMPDLRREMRVLRRVERARRGPLETAQDWLARPGWRGAPVRRLVAAAALILALVAGGWFGARPRTQPRPATPAFDLAKADESYYRLVIQGHQSAEQALPLQGGGYLPPTEYQDTR